MAERIGDRRVFLLDETVIETRLARVEAERLVEIRHFPRLAPAALRPMVGDTFLARIGRSAPGVGGCFADLGDAGAGLVRTRKSPPEGTLATARVMREGYGEKLAVLKLEPTKPAQVGGLQPHRVTPLQQAAGALLASDVAGAEIHVDGDGVLMALRRARPESEGEIIAQSPGLFERAGIEEQIEAALQPVVPLPGGGRLIVEETQGAAVIDVDVGGARRADEVNSQAAQEIALQIALRRLAGTIIIDFARIASRRQLMPLQERLAARAGALSVDIEVGAAGRTGILELRRKRTQAPLAAALTEAGVTHTAVPLRLTRAAEAAKLARLVHSAAAQGAGPLRARVEPGLAHWLSAGEGGVMWTAIAAATAAPLHLQEDEALGRGVIDIERQR